MKLLFDAESHTYSLNGRKIPSVTEIVSPVLAPKYKSDGTAIIEQAKRRGSKVHEYCQLIDLGCPVEALEVEPELAGYIKAYLSFLRDYRPQWDMVEKPVYHPQGLYAGTLDRHGCIDGKPCIVDIKTTGTMDRLSRLALAFQLALYWKCLACVPARLYGVQLKKSGGYKLFELQQILSKDYTSMPVRFPDMTNQLINLAYLTGGYEWQTN